MFCVNHSKYSFLGFFLVFLWEKRVFINQQWEKELSPGSPLCHMPVPPAWVVSGGILKEVQPPHNKYIHCGVEGGEVEGQ